MGHLQECLVEMERFDILTDRTFLGKLGKLTVVVELLYFCVMPSDKEILNL